MLTFCLHYQKNNFWMLTCKQKEIKQFADYYSNKYKKVVQNVIIQTAICKEGGGRNLVFYEVH